MSLAKLGSSVNSSSLQDSAMHDSLSRVASFKTWPQTSQVSPLTLASNGFSYDGSGERTSCNFCKVIVESWSSEDNPIKVHQKKSPQCPFVVSKITKDTTTPFTGSSSQVTQGSQQVSANRISQEPAGYSAFFTSSSSTASAASSDVHVNPASTEAKDAHSEINRTSPDYDRLKTESVRLSTFHDWPSRAADVVDPRDLAAAGLFYTGQADRVQCAFCAGFIRNWVQGDIPMEEHRKHFPDCQLVRETAAEKGPFRNGGDAIDRSPVDLKEDLLTTANSYRSLTTSSASAVRLPRPVHPDFADVSKRKASFRGEQLPRGQTVDVLAEAGFFHVGPDDNVRCFQCDGGLKNWQPGDDPWTEHARWFPRCPFLLANKEGRSLVQNSQNFAGQLLNGNHHTGNAVPDASQEADELLAENLQLKESRTCKVCMDEEVNTVFLPCGHLVCCSNCSPALRHCAICRTLIRGTVRIFLG